MSRLKANPAEHVLEVVTPRTNTARLSSAEHLFGTLVPRGDAAPEPVSLEVVGDAHQRRFLARTTKSRHLRRISAQLAAAYPQAALRPFQSATFPTGDPVQVGSDEQVAAATLQLQAGQYLPLRTYDDRDLDAHGGDSPQSDPLLGILGALADLPQGWRAVCQLVVLAAAPSDWARAYQRLALERPLDPDRRADTGPSLLGPLALLGLIGLFVGGTSYRRFGGQLEQALGLIARHPLLERRQLATLLGTSEPRARQLVRSLTTTGWVRSILPGDAPPDALDRLGRLRQLSFVELTSAGRREAARRLLLPAAVAARHHGLLGGAASTRRFSRQLAHTLGANAVFVAFVVAARRMTARGGDDALEEWRSAAACARGRFRPDGYGCYRRAGARFGFFLEFDRGTEKPREYAAKLAAYYRYRDSGAAARDYTGFPTLLVVTTCATAEARFAYQAHLAQQRHGATPLVIFLTTTSRIEECADGVLGPIWRSPGEPWAYELARICWLPRPQPARAQRDTKNHASASAMCQGPHRLAGSALAAGPARAV